MGINTYMKIETVRSKKNPFKRGLDESPVLWLIPLAIILLVLFVYPVFEVIRLSFTDAKIGKDVYSYTLKSIVSIFTESEFYTMMKVTLFFVVFSVIFQTLLGLIIALSVVQGEKFNMKGTIFVRTVALISMVIPGVIIGIIWRMMFDESHSGLLNYFLENIGIGRVQFLTDPYIAIVSATIANIWRGTAQSMILLYAGLMTVPAEILEAAKVDGANAFTRLIKIIIPSIMPVALINLILNTIGTFNTFDMIMSLTGGGPGRSTEVLALNAYNQIFQLHNMGRGAAVAVFLLCLNTVMASVYFYFIKKSEV